MKTFTGSLEGARTHPAPRIDYWPARRNRRNGLGLVIFPGGGYGGLAAHEGPAFAEYFSRAGLACFVVTYRLGTDGFRHPAMLEDALAAIATVRGRAAEFNVDPARIGVIGSSAGGHLAAHAAVAYTSARCRPDFTILCYPAITMRDPYGHKGGRENLLGKRPSARLVNAVSCERHVTRRTPPCFLWHTGDDPVVPVENSLLFAAALRKHGVPFELHVFDRGRHGLGLNTEHPWAANSLLWLRNLFSPGGAGDC
jgi:acetyl esterase/lipase